MTGSTSRPDKLKQVVMMYPIRYCVHAQVTIFSSPTFSLSFHLYKKKKCHPKYTMVVTSKQNVFLVSQAPFRPLCVFCGVLMLLFVCLFLFIFDLLNVRAIYVWKYGSPKQKILAIKHVLPFRKSIHDLQWVHSGLR